MKRSAIILATALIVAAGAVWWAGAGPQQVMVLAEKTTGDPAGPGDPIWNEIEADMIKTNSNPLLGGHGAVKNKPDIAVKAAYNDENVYMYLEWSDPTNSNLHGWWTFDSSNSVWKQTGEAIEQDRLYLMWPITDVAGREGLTFAQAGCKAYCHRVTGSDLAETPGTIGDCGACHKNTSAPKPESFEHTWVEPGEACSSCHIDRDVIDGVSADMATPAGGAMDIWHWKAQDSYLGFATDQSAMSGKKRGHDGGRGLDSDNKNTSGTAPKYIWPLNADNSSSTGDYNNFVLKSGLPAMTELAANGLTTKDGTSVPDGTTIRKKILNDVDASATVKNIQAQQSYSEGRYRVVLKRSIIGTDTKDYNFNLDDNNYFSIVVTDNSEIKHAGSAGPHILMLDTKAPSAMVVSHKYSTRTSKTKNFPVKWSGMDPQPGSGVDLYDVQYKIRSGGPWTTWKTDTRAVSGTFLGKAGRTYYFRTRAKDKAGNLGAWSGLSKTIVPYNENALIYRRKGFDGTYSKTGSNYFLGTVRYSTADGETIVYKFTGDSVALIGTRAADRSQAKIYVDGVYKKTVDAYAKSTKARQVLYSRTWQKNGTHYLRVVNRTIQNRKRFDVDGLAVGR